MKNHLFFLGFILLCCLTSATALDLKYIDTDYSFHSACQNYEITSDTDLSSLEKPVITSTETKAGSISGCSWTILKPVEKVVEIPKYSTVCQPSTAKNGTSFNNCSYTQTGTDTKTILTTAKVTDFSKEPITTKEPVRVQYCCNIDRSYSKERGYYVEVDVIPELDGKVYTEYAWFNNTYYWRTPINCSAITNTNIPVILNGTGGLYINGSKQYIWTKCVPTLAVYYNNNDDYVVANDTENIPYEIEAGDKAHIDYSLWADYDLVLHCNNETESTGKWVTGFTGVEFVTNVSKIGNSCYFDGVDNIAIDGSFHLNPSKFSIEMYFNALSVDAGVGLLGKCSSANEKDCEHILTTYAGMHSGIGNGAAPFWATSGSYTINTWWAIINELQIDTTFSLYKNNVFNASASLTGTRKSTSTPLYIGKYLLSAGYDYIGSMDEVRLSNKTYTSGEKTQLYNNYNNFSGYGTPLAEEEQPPCSINVTQNSPPMGGTVFEGNISFNFTGVGTNGTFTCSLIIDNITNSTIYSVVNNTETPIYANLSAGLYDWQINCSIYDTCSDLTGEYRLTVNATTTTTTSTTIPTSSTTTYAPIPSYRTGVNDILWIYAVMLPIMAFISTLAVFYFSSSKIKVNEKVLTDDERYVKDLGREKVTRLLQPILPLISSLLWFSSSYTTINIRFIDNFTVILSPYYIDAGNPEIGMLFTGLGVIMGFYFIFTMLQSAVQSGFIRGDSK